MARERLDNARWAFASNCFVCEAANQAGLRIEFFCDRDRASVVADFALGAAFSGAPRYVHGGLVAAVLDEAMAWAAIALAQRFALTRQLQVAFHRPVHVGRPHTVEARLAPGSGRDGELETTALVLRPDGTACASATARLVVLGEAQAVEATGVTELRGARRYVDG